MALKLRSKPNRLPSETFEKKAARFEHFEASTGPADCSTDSGSMALMLGRGISRESHPEPLQDASFEAEPDSPTSRRSGAEADENDGSYVNDMHGEYSGFAASAQEQRKSAPVDASYETPQRPLAQQSEDFDQVLWASAPHQVAVVNTGHVLSAQRYLSEIESVIEEKRNQLLKLRRSNEQRKLSMLVSLRTCMHGDMGVCVCVCDRTRDWFI